LSLNKHIGQESATDQQTTKQQRTRAQRTFGAIAVSAFLCIWLAAGALIDQVQWSAVGYSLLWVCVSSVLFIGMISYNINLRFKDPSLTKPMVLTASACVLANAVVMNSAGWSSIASFIVVAFGFSAFKASQRWLMGLFGALFAMICVAIAWRTAVQPDAILTIWVTIPMVATMFALALYGGLLNQIKDTSRKQQILADLTLSHLSEAIINISPTGQIQAINAAACDLLKKQAQVLIGEMIKDVLDAITPIGDETAGVSLLARSCVIAPNTKTKTILKSQLSVYVNQKQIQLESTTSTVIDHDGTCIGQLLILRDISDQTALMAQLNYAATHDALTGLLNRRGFDEAAAKVLHQMQTAGLEPNAAQTWGLCVIDLDHLKLINDSCGHASGDEFLSQVAQSLQANMRANDVLARIGGDEFAMIIPASNEQELKAACTRFIDIIKAQGYTWQNRSFATTASGGCVLLENKMGPISVALAQSDAALYLAKEQGRAHVQIFTTENLEISTLNNQIQLAGTLLTALEKDHFELYAQRIVAPGPNQEEYLEVLIRLNDPVQGLLTPFRFLPAAERFGLMPAIDRWVLRKTIEAITGQLQYGGAVVKVAVNLSAYSLQDADFLDYVKNLFLQYPQVKQWVAFELTETVAVSNLARAKDFIKEIRALGCEFALDDVGAGFNSLSYLKEMTFDKVKIDGYYIRNLQNDPVNRTIVDSIIKAALSMDLTTVAEMVETESLATELTEMGVDFLQGYHFHKPQPLSELLSAHLNQTPVALNDSVTFVTDEKQ
jgi:diguanylate cyclase (GGDEF)-like protein